MNSLREKLKFREPVKLSLLFLHPLYKTVNQLLILFLTHNLVKQILGAVKTLSIPAIKAKLVPS